MAIFQQLSGQQILAAQYVDRPNRNLKFSEFEAALKIYVIESCSLLVVLAMAQYHAGSLSPQQQTLRRVW